jgi:hypothetical protein
MKKIKMETGSACVQNIDLDPDYIDSRVSSTNKISQDEGFDCDQSPIRELVIRYGLTHAQANRFIGKTEEETMQNVAEFKKHNNPMVSGKKFDINKRLYNIPFGYKVDGNKLSKDESEQRVIAFIMDKYNKGISVGIISDTLKSLGVKTKKGGDIWYPSVIMTIIKRAQQESGENGS